MKGMRWRWLIVAAVGMIAVGCGFGSPVSGPVDQPPGGPAPSAPQGDQVGETVQATMYYVNPQGYVVPIADSIPKVTGIATETLQYMVQGGPGDAVAAKWGLKGSLPPGTKVLGMDIRNGLAKVDFSKEILQYQTPQQERQIVDSVVWALTEFPTIQQVQILVNGRQLQTMPVAGTPIGQPLGRAMGINLNVAGNINPSNTEKLTLYYSGGAGDHTYLVPVTKILPVGSSTDVVKDTMAQLANPGIPGLSSPVTTQVKVLHTSLDGNLATVDFDRSFWNDQKPDQSVAAVVLSLAQSVHVSQVKLTVKGEAPVVKGLDLAKPVSAPRFVNTSQL
ncbi:MAG: GerMN domain-containing protein [Kyrpidia tusciae]|nr:GerMN domain-containing protein [Kyrpidia tusciae]